MKLSLRYWLGVLLAICGWWGTPVSSRAQVVDTRTPAQQKADERAARREKARLQAKFDYAQIATALKKAIHDNPVVDGVDLTSTKIDETWDWHMAEAYANPTCGDWRAWYYKNWWGRVTAIHFAIPYDAKTKRLDPNANGFIEFIFITRKVHGKIAVTFVKADADDEVIVLSPFSL